MKAILITIMVILSLVLVWLVYELVKDVNKKNDLPKKKVIWLFASMGIVLLLLSTSQYYLYFYVLSPPPNWTKEWREDYIACIGCFLLSIASFVFAIKLKYRKEKKIG